MDPATALAVGEKEVQDCGVEECSIKMSSCNKVLGWTDKLLSKLLKQGAIDVRSPVSKSTLICETQFNRQQMQIEIYGAKSVYCEMLTNNLQLNIIQAVIPFLSPCLWTQRPQKTPDASLRHCGLSLSMLAVTSIQMLITWGSWDSFTLVECCVLFGLEMEALGPAWVLKWPHAARLTLSPPTSFLCYKVSTTHIARSSLSQSNTNKSANVRELFSWA